MQVQCPKIQEKDPKKGQVMTVEEKIKIMNELKEGNLIEN